MAEAYAPILDEFLPAQMGYPDDFGLEETEESLLRRPMSDDEVLSAAQNEIHNSIGAINSMIAEHRRLALRYFEGRPLGNEVKDRSTVQSRDLMETVEWLLPSVMRSFFGGRELVEFTPVSDDPEDLKNAKLATAYINHLCLNGSIDMFSLWYECCKTALIEKNGILKVWWDERRKASVRSFTGMTRDEMQQLLEDNDDIDVLAAEEGEDLPDGTPTYNITIKEWRVIKKVNVVGVPPEEFLIARRAIKLNDDTPFTAHRIKVSVSDLVSMGFDYDLVSKLPTDDSPDFSLGRTERRSYDETFPEHSDFRTDPASRELWVTECHMKIDQDNDGYAELRQLIIAGENTGVLLDNVEEDMNPFVSITAVPMPFKFHGLSMWDLVADVQRIRTALLRQMMDNVYIANAPRLAVLEGAVNYSDLLTSRPGGMVRVRQIGAIEPIMTSPLPREAFELYNIMEDVRGNRTGVIAHGTEIDASSINTTATGQAALLAEKAQKVELIVRIFQKTGFTDLFRKILRLVVENDTKEHQLQVNGEWMTFTPSEWNWDMGVNVQVGLGAGQAVEKLNNLGHVAAAQEKLIMSGGMGFNITPVNVHNLVTAISETVGHTSENEFFTNPEGREPPQPPPSPEMLTLQLEEQKFKADAEAKAREYELSMLKEQGIQEHRQAQLEMNERTEMARIESQERIGLGQQEATIEAAQISANAREQEDDYDWMEKEAA